MADPVTTSTAWSMKEIVRLAADGIGFLVLIISGAVFIGYHKRQHQDMDMRVSMIQKEHYERGKDCPQITDANKRIDIAGDSLKVLHEKADRTESKVDQILGFIRAIYGNHTEMP